MLGIAQLLYCVFSFFFNHGILFLEKVAKIEESHVPFPLFPIATSYTTVEHHNREIDGVITHRIYSNILLFAYMSVVCVCFCAINTCNYYSQYTELFSLSKDLPSATFL